MTYDHKARGSQKTSNMNYFDNKVNAFLPPHAQILLLFKTAYNLQETNPKEKKCFRF